VAAKLIGVVVPLGLDTFAVALALGLQDITPRSRMRLSLWFAGFEATMPLVGLALGKPLGTAIGSVADYVAGGVLVALGVRELVGADDDGEGGRLGSIDRGGLAGMVALAIGISLDELAIGFSAGLLGLPMVAIVVAVAVQALVVTQLGIRLGSRLGGRARERTEKLAGFALLALGAAVVIARLSA
jgi:manganese efflux pump family protein